MMLLLEGGCNFCGTEILKICIFQLVTANYIFFWFFIISILLMLYISSTSKFSYAAQNRLKIRILRSTSAPAGLYYHLMNLKYLSCKIYLNTIYLNTIYKMHYIWNTNYNLLWPHLFGIQTSLLDHFEIRVRP